MKSSISSCVTANLILRSSKFKLSQLSFHHAWRNTSLRMVFLPIQIICVFVKFIFKPETCTKESQIPSLPSFDWNAQSIIIGHSYAYWGDILYSSPSIILSVISISFLVNIPKISIQSEIGVWRHWVALFYGLFLCTIKDLPRKQLT